MAAFTGQQLCGCICFIYLQHKHSHCQSDQQCKLCCGSELFSSAPLFILLSQSKWKAGTGRVIFAHMCLEAPLMTGPRGGAHDEWLSIGDRHTATMMWVKNGNCSLSPSLHQFRACVGLWNILQLLWGFFYVFFLRRC